MLMVYVEVLEGTYIAVVAPRPTSLVFVQKCLMHKVKFCIHCPDLCVFKAGTAAQNGDMHARARAHTQIDRQAGRQAARQTDRQTDRQTRHDEQSLKIIVIVTLSISVVDSW